MNESAQEAVNKRDAEIQGVRAYPGVVGGGRGGRRKRKTNKPYFSPGKAEKRGVGGEGGWRGGAGA